MFKKKKELILAKCLAFKNKCGERLKSQHLAFVSSFITHDSLMKTTVFPH